MGGASALGLGAGFLIAANYMLPVTWTVFRHVLTLPGCRVFETVCEDEALSTVNAVPTLSSVPMAA